MGNDVVVVFEYPVGQPVLPHKLPQVLDRVQFGRPRRQEQQGDVVGYFEFRRDVPSSLINDQHGMSTFIDRLADFEQMLVHGMVHGIGVAVGKNKARSFALLGADGAEDISPHRALIEWCRRPCALACPSSGDLVLLPYPSFVGPPELDLDVLGEPAFDGCQCGGEVFLKLSRSPSFWA